MINGFSKLNRAQKVALLTKECDLKEGDEKLLSQFLDFGADLNQRFEGFSENVVSAYPFPYSIAPNFFIDGHLYHVPMVIEESSVVAAASYAAKFWAAHGGFRCTVKGTQKIGQIFFKLQGLPTLIHTHFEEIKALLLKAVKPFTQNMEKRGGGVIDLFLKDFSEQLNDVYCIEVAFETVDSMGANFINTCLEAMAAELKRYMRDSSLFENEDFEVIMAILSNYTPECVVECKVECAVNDLKAMTPDRNGALFAEKFVKAVQIAEVDPYRAATHNKGIYNGISAVLLATANDFRAVEAAGHAYAAKAGRYKSLSHAEINDGKFSLTLEVPLAIGTVGGLTKLHPMANLSFEIMGRPNAHTLMKIIAAAGLSNNFAAVRSLTTTGIQAGHMKMHLNNILQFEGVDSDEKASVLAHFSDKTVTYTEVKDFLVQMRKTN